MGDEAAAQQKPRIRRRRTSSELQRSGGASNVSAGVRLGDNSRAAAAASGSAAQAAVARCEAARRNCCTRLARHLGCATSAHALGNPDSNTEPSNPADIALFLSSCAIFESLAAGRGTARRWLPRKLEIWRDCAPVALVCQAEYLLLVVARLLREKKRLLSFVSVNFLVAAQVAPPRLALSETCCPRQGAPKERLAVQSILLRLLWVAGGLGVRSAFV